MDCRLDYRIIRLSDFRIDFFALCTDGACTVSTENYEFPIKNTVLRLFMLGRCFFQCAAVADFMNWV